MLIPGKIHILHVMGILNYGGAETMIMNLYRHFDRDAFQFDFVVHQKERGLYEDEIESLGGKIYRCPTFKGTNIHQYKKWWNDFFDIHKEYQIMHTHVYSSASFYLPIARKHGVITISHSHSASTGKDFKSFVKRILCHRLRNQADYFFACSVDAGKWLFGEKVVKGDHFYVLKNAIDVAKFKFNEENRRKIRQEFKLEDDTILIGNIGRLTPQKNHHYLLSVFSALHKKDSKYKFMLVGDGELKEEVIRRIDELGLKDSVIMTGPRSDVPSLLSAMDVFAFPSLWEGLGIVLIESQASGLRTFCSNVIPLDADLSELITYLPINNGVENWVKAILNADLSRIDVSENIINAGYDIGNSSAWLMNFYRSIIENRILEQS